MELKLGNSVVGGAGNRSRILESYYPSFFFLERSDFFSCFLLLSLYIFLYITEDLA